MTLAELQEETLWRHAEAIRTWRYAVFFHAARGELALLHERCSCIRAYDAAGIRAYRLACLAEEASLADRLLDDLAEETDIWVYYTLAKCFLGQGRLSEAFKVAKLSMAADTIEGRRNSCVLNLIIKYLAHKGETKGACDLIGGVLKLDPQQQDLAAFRQRLIDGEGSAPEPYLGVRPRLETVTVYVPVYNGGEAFGGTIESLLGQSYPLHEYIVVDDGSTDDSAAVARRYPVRLVGHEANRGLAAARNTAFEVATGRYVAAIDADVLADVDMLKYMMMEFENALPVVVGVGARLLERHTETPPDHWRFCHLSQDSGPHRVAPRDAISGAKTLFRRDAVLGVGGFDERYRTNYEDVDVCRRLRAAGHELVATPYALAGHLRRDTARSVLRTAWNYVFWATHEAGFYATKERLAELLLRSLRGAFEVLQWDATNGSERLLYLDFLYLTTVAFCDIEFAAREGTVSSEEGRALQEAILGQIGRANADHGEALAARARDDMAYLLVNAEPGEVPSECAPYLDVLGHFLMSAGDEMYGLLLVL